MEIDKILDSAIYKSKEVHTLRCKGRDPKRCGCEQYWTELRNVRLELVTRELSVRRNIANDVEAKRKELINDNENKSEYVFLVDTIAKLFLDVIDPSGLTLESRY